MDDRPLIPPVQVVAASVPEGHILDFLTGEAVRDTPEEYVRQNIEKALVRQYKYLPSDCQPEFRLRMGSSKPRVDIAVFPNGAPHLQENALLLVETKRSGTSPTSKKDGIDQLKSYLAGCVNAAYGLWTNGDDRFCFAKQSAEGRLEFVEIVDIPGHGQSLEEAYRPTLRDLMPATADNLLFAFRRSHNYIAGAEGLQKPEAFWELLKLIFCKIEDERSSALDFYVTPDELRNSTQAASAKARLQNLLTSKVAHKYPKIFTGKDSEINLKPNVVAYVVSQLQRYSLLDSSIDVKGVAYEEIVGSNLRGDRGEFFTPRNACRMAVSMLAPRPFERVLDPACGTGGFLITAMNQALIHLEDAERPRWRDPSEGTQAELGELFRKINEYLSSCVYGLDLNPALVRAAKMNMVLNNDGEGNLFQADSLANPHTWGSGAAQKIPLGSVDVLLTNPPFGANIVIDDEHILGQYDLAAIWDRGDDGNWAMRLDPSGNKVLQKSQPPEILFIERCVQFLKPGPGRMAMVIPNGILNNPALEYVRSWMIHNVQVVAVVDMARELFMPKNDTQTSMVVMRRLSEQERAIARDGRLDYPIFMAVTDKIGHDKRGNPVYRQAPDGSDLLVMRRERIIDIDPATGDDRVIEIEAKDRMIDDELPEVAAAFSEWAQARA